MTIPEYPPWQRKYQEALRESDPQELEEKIGAVEGAIFLRFQELRDADEHDSERTALKEALRTLRALQTEKLHYPKLPNE